MSKFLLNKMIEQGRIKEPSDKNIILKFAITFIISMTATVGVMYILWSMILNTL